MMERISMRWAKVLESPPTLIEDDLQASLYEKNFQNTFFGSHYARLKSIKRVYDPNDLFIVASGVGSDDWDKSLNCPLN